MSAPHVVLSILTVDADRPSTANRSQVLVEDGAIKHGLSRSQQGVAPTYCTEYIEHSVLFPRRKTTSSSSHFCMSSAHSISSS